MGKNLLLKAENHFLKAKQLYEARQFKKSAKKYNSAAHKYLSLDKFEEAKISFINGANSFIELDRIGDSLKLLRSAGDAAILNNNNDEANDIFKKSISIIPKLRSSDDKNHLYILFSVLSYLCSFANAKQEEGLKLIKKIQKKVDNSYFKEHSLIVLVTELTICLRDKNPKYLEKIEKNIQNFDFNNSELKLLKKILLIAKISLSLISKLDLDKTLYTTNDLVNFKVYLETQPIVSITKNNFYDYEIQNFKITKLNLNLSDNLSLNKKPKLPIGLEIGNDYTLKFTIKPHFQLDNPVIGPLSLIFEINNNLRFIYKTDEIRPKIISPPPTLDIFTKNLRTPLIDQTFPLEILVKNNSEGEAMDVNINTEFPEELKIMRGTTSKKIYSIRPNEQIKWEINVKPLEAGDFKVKVNIHFKDPDQNLLEEVKEVLISIKL